MTQTQQWWREKRLPEIEAKACHLLMSYERRRDVLSGCTVKTELLLPTVECDMVYFDDDERAEYRIPEDAIGALKPQQRLIFIYQHINDAGRENQTVGEEIGHFVLHAKDVPPLGQPALGLEESVTDERKRAFFCRTVSASYVDGEVEPPWMSREAAFFAACLQMPRERYRPAALRELRRGLHERPASFGHGGSFSQKTDKLASVLKSHDVANLTEQAILELTWKCFDTALINEALDELEYIHEGTVSRKAQRRRMVELGLLHDAADVLAEYFGITCMPRFDQFILSDEVIKGRWDAF